jgi:glyoxylase-like metal-dependent hydrolase (beta-lactamase superfamily II)
MRRAIVAVVIAVMFVAALAFQPPSASIIGAQSRPRPAGTAHSGNAFRFNQVKPGVYHAVGTGSLAVVGNSSFIVNDNDVIVVDDHVSPAAAWVLLEEIKTVTPKPVTTVINTHFHFDHAHGNQIFEPNVDIIGHEFTRRMLLSNSIGMPLYQNYLTGMPGQIEDLRKRVAAENNAAAKAKL